MATIEAPVQEIIIPAPFDKGAGKKVLNELRSANPIVTQTTIRDNFVVPFTLEAFGISVIQDAFELSESELRQEPVDDKKVDTLLKKIFVTDGCLFEPITLAKVGEQYYGVGGRHRTAAILKATETLVDGYEQLIPVIMLHLKDMDALLSAIVYDNTTRKMSRLEVANLSSQHFGVNPDDVSSYITALENARKKSATNALGVLSTLVAAKLREKNIFVVVGTGDSTRTVYLSHDVLFAIAKNVSNYLVRRAIPRPPAPKVNQFTALGESVEDAQQLATSQWDSTYPVPEKQDLYLSYETLASYVDGIVTLIADNLNGFQLTTEFPAREVPSAGFQYDLMTLVHTKFGAELDAANQAAKDEYESGVEKQKATAKRNSGTKNILDMFKGVLSDVDVSKLDATALQQALLNALKSQQA